MIVLYWLCSCIKSSVSGLTLAGVGGGLRWGFLLEQPDVLLEAIIETKVLE